MSEFRVFISYAAADAQTVLPLMEVLRDAEYTLVDASLFAGTPTHEQLYGVMLTCEAFVSLLSQPSLDSDICNRAYDAAVEAGIPIVPLMPDDILTQDVGLLIQNAIYVPPDEVVPVLPVEPVTPPAAEAPPPAPPPFNPGNQPMIYINFPRWVYALVGLVIIMAGVVLASILQPRTIVITPTALAVQPKITLTATPSPTATATLTPTPTITPTPLPAGAVPFEKDSGGILIATVIEGLTEGLTGANVEFTSITQPVRSQNEARSLGTGYNAAVVLWSAPDDAVLHLEFMPENPADSDRVVPHYWQSFQAANAPYLLPFVQALNHFVKLDASGALTLLDAAAALIPEAEQVNQHAEIVYFYRGVVQDWLGNYEAAAQDYTRALQINPALPEAVFNRGVARYQNRDFDGAIEDFTQVLSLRPDDAITFYYRGNVYLTMENLEAALEDYNRALEIRPDYTNALNNRGTVYGKQGNFNAALLDYNRAIEVNPDFASAYSNRGLVYRNLADYEKAIQDYDRAIQLDPNRPESYYTRGVIYATLKEYDVALVNFNRAAILAPEDAKILYMRGVTRVFQQDTTGAEVDFKQAITLEPGFPDPYAALGALYETQGNAAAAIEAYRQHIALAGDNALAFAVSGLQKLQALSTVTPQGQ